MNKKSTAIDDYVDSRLKAIEEFKQLAKILKKESIFISETKDQEKKCNQSFSGSSTSSKKTEQRL